GAATARSWMWPVAVTLVCLTAIGVGGFLYFTKLETSATKVASSSIKDASPAPSASTAPTPAPAPTMAAPAPPPPPTPISSGEKFAAEAVPFVPDRTRIILANEYLPAADYKAFALNT